MTRPAPRYFVTRNVDGDHWRVIDGANGRPVGTFHSRAAARFAANEANGNDRSAPTEVVTFRCRPRELSDLFVRATAAGVDRSTYVRAALVHLARATDNGTAPPLIELDGP